ncbi:hypothetical protein Bbelb_052230 [Branchiostoma belcheri]|nr:hypothetical protein Bbelb_052230 [Branchiostoma belcheri]
MSVVCEICDKEFAHEVSVSDEDESVMDSEEIESTTETDSEQSGSESDASSDVSSDPASSDDSEEYGYDSGDEEEWTLYRDWSIILPNDPGDVPQRKCTNGYQLLAQTCIKVYSYEKDYGEALAVCEKDGAILAMPKTRELDVALRNLIRKVGVDFEYWIGLVFCEHWRWADGSRISKYKYKTGEGASKSARANFDVT